MANPDRSGPPIKSPSATALVQGLNRAIPTAWAVDVYDPGFVLIASPGNGLRRMTHGQFTRGMRHWRNCVEARRIGRLIDVHYLRYDRGERTATMARDCINRPYLTIGPVLTAAIVLQGGETDDLSGDVDRLFTYREDADRAAHDIAALATMNGASVEHVAKR